MIVTIFGVTLEKGVVQPQLGSKIEELAHPERVILDTSVGHAVVVM